VNVNPDRPVYRHSLCIQQEDVKQTLVTVVGQRHHGPVGHVTQMSVCIVVHSLTVRHEAHAVFLETKPIFLQRPETHKVS